jgi:Tfp pilus assembly protein PilN
MPRPSASATPRGSFLPEDYLRKKVERRSIMFAFVLFAIVVFGVVAAFFVTNRERVVVERRQAEVNTEVIAENQKLEQLKQLQAVRSQMVEKAEITTALIERVPRSILLAELINRMPDNVTLTDMVLKSKRITEKPKAPVTDTGAAAPTRTLSAAGVPVETKPTRPPPPRFEFAIELTGISSSDQDVADYHTALLDCKLLSRVDLIRSSEVVIDEVSMRKFRIDGRIRPDADARQITPLQVPRLAGKPGGAETPEGETTPGAKRHGKDAKPHATVIPEQVFENDPTVPRMSPRHADAAGKED